MPLELPTFRSVRERRRGLFSKEDQNSSTPYSPQETRPIDASPLDLQEGFPHVDIKQATRTRRNAILVSTFFFFIISTIFLLLTTIGNLSNRAVLKDSYFLHLDLAHVYTTAFHSTNLVFVNSIARSLGLHDFYQVGMWNYCEGYTAEGVTGCSTPTAGYWFNPVEILMSELLRGATVSLPSNVTDILGVLRIASQAMFGCILSGLVLNFLAIFASFAPLYSRWWSLPVGVLSFLAALVTTGGVVVATVLFVVFRNVVISQAGLNIRASIGKPMFAFMWIGAAASLIAFGIQLCLACCCASRRDVRTGRKRGRRTAYERPSTGSSGTLMEKEKAPTEAHGGMFQRIMHSSGRSSLTAVD